MAWGKRKVGSKKLKELEDTGVQKSKGSFLSALDFYTSMIAEFSEHYEVPTRSLGTGEFYYTAESIHTKNGVKKIFFINDLPSTMHRGFISDLRHSIDKEVNRYNIANNEHTVVSLNLVMHCDYYDLNFGNRRIKAVWNSFGKQYKRVQKDLEGRDITDALKSDKYQKSVIQKVNSFLHIQDAESAGASFYKTKVALELVVKDDSPDKCNEVILVAEKIIKEFGIRYDIKYKRAFLKAHTYQRSFGPSASDEKTLIKNQNPGDIWADDTINGFNVPQHGLVGDEYGVPHGIDIYSGQPVSIDLTQGTNGKNCLVAAGTGEGKSHMMKMLYTFYSPDKQYDTIAFDYEGSEYKPIGYINNANIIDMGSASGAYIDTLIIADAVGDLELDENRKQRAIDVTTNVFHVLFKDEYQGGMSGEQLAIFSDLLSETYANAGVGEDPNTWSNSKDLNFFQLYNTLRTKFLSGKSSVVHIANHGEPELKKFRNTLKPYFEEGGMYSTWFNNPLSINEFMSNRHNIFSFGQGGVSRMVGEEKSIILRQLFASYLTMAKAAQNSVKGVYTVVMIEELQRYLDQPYAAVIVKDLITGGRKLGLINYLITNDPSSLVSSGDIDSPLVQEHFTGIKDNINMFLLGAMFRNPMDGLIDTFGLENAEEHLYGLVKIKENNVKSGGLKHCFFIKVGGISTIIKADSHPELKGLPLYHTDVNPVNDDLRMAETTSGSAMKIKIGQAYDKDGKWDKEKCIYTDRRGFKVKTKWDV